MERQMGRERGRMMGEKQRWTGRGKEADSQREIERQGEKERQTGRDTKTERDRLKKKEIDKQDR